LLKKKERRESKDISNVTENTEEAVIGGERINRRRKNTSNKKLNISKLLLEQEQRSQHNHRPGTRHQIADLKTIFQMKKSTPKSMKNNFTLLMNPSPKDRSENLNKMFAKPSIKSEKELVQLNLPIEINQISAIKGGSPQPDPFKLNRSMVSESIENFNFSNYNSRIFEGEQWRVPNKSVAQRHSRELVFSNLPGGKNEDGLASFDRPPHLILPGNVSLAEQSMLETKRSHEVINQLNSNNESFNSKLPLFPMMGSSGIHHKNNQQNNSSSVLEPGEDTLRQLSSYRDNNTSVVKNVSLRSDINDRTDDKIRLSANLISKLQNGILIMPETSGHKERKESISPDAAEIEQLTSEILTHILDSLLTDDLFSIFFMPEKKRGIQSNYNYIKFYIDKLTEYVLDNMLDETAAALDKPLEPKLLDKLALFYGSDDISDDGVISSPYIPVLDVEVFLALEKKLRVD
jgi:hypothetical protein